MIDLLEIAACQEAGDLCANRKPLFPEPDLVSAPKQSLDFAYTGWLQLASKDFDISRRNTS